MADERATIRMTAETPLTCDNPQCPEAGRCRGVCARNFDTKDNRREVDYGEAFAILHEHVDKGGRLVYRDGGKGPYIMLVPGKDA